MKKAHSNLLLTGSSVLRFWALSPSKRIHSTSVVHPSWSFRVCCPPHCRWRIGRLQCYDLCLWSDFIREDSHDGRSGHLWPCHPRTDSKNGEPAVSTWCFVIDVRCSIGMFAFRWGDGCRFKHRVYRQGLGILGLMAFNQMISGFIYWNLYGEAAGSFRSISDQGGVSIKCSISVTASFFRSTYKCAKTLGMESMSQESLKSIVHARKS